MAAPELVAPAMLPRLGLGGCYITSRQPLARGARYRFGTVAHVAADTHTRNVTGLRVEVEARPTYAQNLAHLRDC